MDDTSLQGQERQGSYCSPERSGPCCPSGRPSDRLPRVSRDGSTSYRNWGRAKQRLDQLILESANTAPRGRGCEIAHWRLHDLRRTMVTGMVTLNVPHHVADKILNHQSGAISGVTAVYQRHEFMQERKQALEAWGRHVAALLHGRETERAA